ncbi:MAG TPA: DUF664 domain-containing protein [Nocardioidaceae bacterium]|nr:DUF664 domain-containing protein [Nocardioidaceae bacterium]
MTEIDTTWTPPPWEPPLAGTEAEQLIGALERMRATFRFKVDGLDAAGLRTQLPTSSLTLAGLIKHLAVQEDYASTVKLTGDPLGPPWDDNGWDGDDDWEINSAVNDPPELLYAFWDDAIARSRARWDAAIADGGLDQRAHVSAPNGHHASRRRVLVDLLEEYCRHTGHADLLREAVDGRVGEDPPIDWQPTGAVAGA